MKKCSSRTYALAGILLAGVSGLFILIPLWQRSRMAEADLPFWALVGLIFGLGVFLINRDRDSCAQQSGLRKILTMLRPRSWKHWLFWVELMPAVIVMVIMSVVGWFAMQAHTDRYDPLPMNREASMPKLNEVDLPFIHQYDPKSLPFLASAIIDIDNDGTEEIFLGGGQGQSDTLFAFVNDKFTALGFGAKSNTEPTYGANVLDLDKNGWDDLIVTRPSGVYWYQNDRGDFIEKDLGLEFDDKTAPLSLTLGDINNDGHADIFVTGYIKKQFVQGLTIFTDPDYGGKSRLFLNNGDNIFTDITGSAGLDYRHNTFQGVFVDLDNDADSDLVVAYDTGQVRTYENNGDLTFTNKSNPTSEYFAYPMGVGVGDYDNDGDVDLVFSNVGDLGILNGALRGDLKEEQVLNRKLILLRNDGDFKFTDVAQTAKVADYEFSWGLIFEDFNNDSKQDLVIAQNYVDLPQHKLFKSPGRFLLQAERNMFTASGDEVGFESKDYGIAPLAADFNGDGVLDLVMANLSGPAKAFISQPLPERFLRIRLPNNADSLGAKVTFNMKDGSVLQKTFLTGEGMSSDGSHILHFGLGDKPQLKNIQIDYPSGGSKIMDKFVYNTTLILQSNDTQ